MRFTVITAAAALFAFAGTAAAEQVYTGNDKVEITLTGEVSAKCGFEAAPEARLDLGNLKASRSARVAMTVGCNQPLTYTLTSANGALVNQNYLGRAPSGFTHEVGYTATVNLDGHSFAGGSTHDSATLTGAGQSRTSDGVPFSKDLTLDLNWSIEGEPLAGEYQDVITIAVAAAS